MLGTFLAVCTMGLAAAAVCTGDNIDGSCLTAESSSCITECARREFNASCSSTPGLEQQPECLPSNQCNPARNLLGPSGLNQLCERGWLLLGSAPVSNSPILPEHEHLQPNHMRQRSKCKQLRCSWLALSDDDFLHESTLCALSVPDCLPNGTGLLLDRVHAHRPELHRVHVCMRELFSGPLAERLLVVPRTHGPIVHSER